MDTVLSWLFNKGIEALSGVLADELERSLRTEDNVEVFLRQQLADLEDKIDTVLQAPAKQALMHLKEGNLVQYRDKLIEAISHNDFDLGSLLMYINLLRREGRYCLALDYQWELMDRFGPRADIVPRPLLEVYVAKQEQALVDNAKTRKWSYEEVDYHCREIHVSAGGVITCWVRPANGWQLRFSDKSLVVGLNWRGEQLFRFADGDPSVLNLTARYAVVRTGEHNRVVDLRSDKASARTITPEELISCFVGSEAGRSIPAEPWQTRDQNQFISDHFVVGEFCRTVGAAPISAWQQSHFDVFYGGTLSFGRSSG
jgi:hypothetical protein